MKIAIIGYGKMGKTIEKVAINRGHEIVSKINATPTATDLELADVAIEFSRPEYAFENIKTTLENHVPVVSGTTGWLDKKNKIDEIVLNENTAFIYASNFSLGVNLFNVLAEKMAKIMAPYKNYTAEIEEIHHTEKLDAPSGTAISLAEIVIENSQFDHWSLDEKTEGSTLNINALREENVPGTHTLSYVSNEDTISLEHVAHSREGFALGAVLAAEYIKDKKGIFTMKDVLGLQ